MDLTDIYNFIDTETCYGHEKDFIAFNKVLSYLNIDTSKFKIIHIAGTNGKGSTAGFIASILSEDNKKTGIFSSPHVSDYRERIKFNNLLISEADLYKITFKIKDNYDEIKNILKRKLSYFEMSFLISLLYFDYKKCEYIIVEAGIGGKNDITNCLKNKILSIITTISNDHENILGDSLEKIALNKSGIMMKNSKFLTYRYKNEIDDIFIKEARKNNSKIYFYDKSDINIINMDIDRSIFRLRDYEKDIFKIRLFGYHQIENASLAIKAISIIDSSIDISSIKNGIKKFELAGRMETISKNPRIIIDGGHNSEALKVLYENIKNKITEDDILIFGMMKDKDIFKEIKILTNLFDNIILTKAMYERAFEPEELLSELKLEDKNIILAENISGAYEEATKLAKETSKIICTGSFYLIGELKEIVNDRMI